MCVECVSVCGEGVEHLVFDPRPPCRVSNVLSVCGVCVECVSSVCWVCVECVSSVCRVCVECVLSVC